MNDINPLGIVHTYACVVFSFWEWIIILNFFFCVRFQPITPIWISTSFFFSFRRNSFKIQLAIACDKSTVKWYVLYSRDHRWMFFIMIRSRYTCCHSVNQTSQFQSIYRTIAKGVALDCHDWRQFVDKLATGVPAPLGYLRCLRYSWLFGVINHFRVKVVDV